MTKSGNWLLQLPEELRALNQWCIAGHDKAPYLPDGTGLRRAKVTSGPWLSFNDAVQWAERHNLLIGFILCESDPFCCIDLDIKDITDVDSKGQQLQPHQWTTQKQLDGYTEVIANVASYTDFPEWERRAYLG